MLKLLVLNIFEFNLLPNTFNTRVYKLYKVIVTYPFISDGIRLTTKNNTFIVK
jgi:hypothetical protein